MRGQRYSTGGGAHNRTPPPSFDGWKRPAWLGACALLGLGYPFVALLNPPWTYVILGLPLLAAAWLTRPMNPGVRLFGFAAFLAGAGLSWALTSLL